jgi:hypothetical protein
LSRPKSFLSYISFNPRKNPTRPRRQIPSGYFFAHACPTFNTRNTSTQTQQTNRSKLETEMDDRDQTMTKLVTLRCQEPLASALQKAADKRFCSISVVAREATAKFLRDGGLLDEPR